MKRVIPVICWTLIGLFFSIGAPSCNLDDLHEDYFTKERLLTASADKLKQTTITSHLKHSITRGTNLIWCGSFQLSWNEVIKLIGDKIRLEGSPPDADILNEQSFTKADLDGDCYLALAGFVRDGIYEKIPRELNRKFKGKASPSLLPKRDLASRPQDIVVYCYLFKNLEFPTPFQRSPGELRFMGEAVRSYGIGAGPSQSDTSCLYDQVKILYYKNREDFAIELKTKSTGDTIILAKIQPEANLAQTIQQVDKSAKASATIRPTPGDILEIPKMNFDLTRHYREFLRRQLITDNPKIAKDLYLLGAEQNLRFEMDEKGVRLRSESNMSFGCSAEACRVEHHMIFDKPFLLLLRKTGREVPYFAMWIENTELLQPTEKP